MTALDQAFIKAYHQQGATPTSAPLAFARPVHLDEALAGEGAAREESTSKDQAAAGDRESISEALEAALTNPRRPSCGAADVSGKSELVDERDGRADETVPDAGRERRRAEPARVVSEKADDAVMQTRTLGQKSPLSADTLGIPGIALPPSPRSTSSDSEEASAGDAEGAVETESTPSNSGPPAAGSTNPDGSSEPEAASPANEPPTDVDSTNIQAPTRLRPLRALLQVDSFAWPSIALRLCQTAGEQIDAMCDRLAETNGGPGRIALFGNCRRGDGCTSLLLAAARRLLERGLRVVLVDADAQYPKLAQRLGLLPEIGWQDLLDNGLPLDEALIESVEDGLTLLASKEVSDDDEPELAVCGGAPSRRLKQFTDELRTGFDVVLVDAGSLDRLSGTNAAAEVWIKNADRVVLVQNMRSTPSHLVERIERQLADSGARELGIVENFR